MFRTRLRVAGLDIDFAARGPFDVDRFRHRFGPYERDDVPVGSPPGDGPVERSGGLLSLRLWVEPLGKQLGPADIPYPGVKAYVTPTGVKLLREGLSMWLGADNHAEAFARGPQRLPSPPHEEDAGPADPPLRILASHALLRRGAGALVHASGVLYRGRGVLFVGPSGAGKTTCARLAPPESVLSDDQVALLETPAGLALESTPFVGLFGRVIAPTRTPLGALVVLDRARVGRLEPLGHAEALGALLRCLPLYTRTADTASTALRLAERLVREAPLWRGAPALEAPLGAWLERLDALLGRYALPHSAVVNHAKHVAVGASHDVACAASARHRLCGHGYALHREEREQRQILAACTCIERVNDRVIGLPLRDVK